MTHRTLVLLTSLFLAGCSCSEMVEDVDAANGVDASTICRPGVDTDFDGYDECMDCDDANGAVHPTREELCNGVDEDCDGFVDEDYDMDGDTYATCTRDPLLFDCDDTMIGVHPSADEGCGSDAMGNGIDDDCDGYVDDGCAPCESVDGDGDGVSECMGDCDDSDSTVSPQLPEQCDGRDTDCNIFTTRNCAVSESCHFESGADDCEEDLLCACVINASGACMDTYVCASFCQGSFTGPLGSGCTDTQSCHYHIGPSDNQHGCAETTDPIGALAAGEECASDAECRSQDCGIYCNGPGCSRCVDYCDHHEPGAEGSCAPGTICEIVLTARLTQPAMYATCRLDDNGTGTTGDPCDAGCMWGAQSCVDGVCAEPCGYDAHCPNGYHCSLSGPSLELGTWGAVAPYVEGETAIDAVPVCLANGAGAHERQAGAACAQNGDCASEFCDRMLGACVALCAGDATCPTGLTCEPQFVRTSAGVTLARACVSNPVDALLEAM